MRTRTDEELKKLLDDGGEEVQVLIGFGMIPMEWQKLKLSNEDVAALMKLNPKGHL